MLDIHFPFFFPCSFTLSLFFLSLPHTVYLMYSLPFYISLWIPPVLPSLTAFSFSPQHFRRRKVWAKHKSRRVNSRLSIAPPSPIPLSLFLPLSRLLHTPPLSLSPFFLPPLPISPLSLFPPPLSLALHLSPFALFLSQFSTSSGKVWLRHKSRRAPFNHRGSCLSILLHVMKSNLTSR